MKRFFRHRDRAQMPVVDAATIGIDPRFLAICYGQALALQRQRRLNQIVVKDNASLRRSMTDIMKLRDMPCAGWDSSYRSMAFFFQGYPLLLLVHIQHAIVVYVTLSPLCIYDVACDERD
jgi:hypothetical protein